MHATDPVHFWLVLRQTAPAYACALLLWRTHGSVVTCTAFAASTLHSVMFYGVAEFVGVPLNGGVWRQGTGPSHRKAVEGWWLRLTGYAELAASRICVYAGVTCTWPCAQLRPSVFNGGLCSRLVAKPLGSAAVMSMAAPLRIMSVSGHQCVSW